MLVAATVAQHGMEGLILATFLSGLMLAVVEFLRLGTFIKFIPFPLTVGFTPLTWNPQASPTLRVGVA